MSKDANSLDDRVGSQRDVGGLLDDVSQREAEGAAALVRARAWGGDRRRGQ